MRSPHSPSSRFQRGQSLIEFAVLLPAVLILILLIVRAMMILSIWLNLTQTTNIAVRAAALTGQAREACQIISENLVGYAPERLTVKISFGPQSAQCQFVPDTSAPNSAPRVVITVTPDLPKFLPPVTPSPTAQTPTPGQTLVPTITPNPISVLDTRNLPDLPIQIELRYKVLLVGPLVETWSLELGANAIARLEARIPTIYPTPTRDFF